MNTSEKKAFLYGRKTSEVAEAIQRLANVYQVKDPESFQTFTFEEPDLT